MKPCKFQGIITSPHGSFDKSRLCQNVEKERKKCPLKTVVLAIDEKENGVVGVELRSGGGLHGPEKPGWSAGDMEK